MENAIKSESQQAIIICGDEYKGLQPAANGYEGLQPSCNEYEGTNMKVYKQQEMDNMR